MKRGAACLGGEDYLRNVSSRLNLREQFFNIPYGDKVLAEYVWIGGAPETYFSGFDLRCKTKTLDEAPKSTADLPIWNYDGSSTNQAPGKDSEVLLRPCRIFKDPFRKGPHIMVMCDTLLPNMEPTPSNTRAACAASMAQAQDAKPWFGIEQEYTMFDADEDTPLGFPRGGMPYKQQGPYYCGVGSGVSFGREIVEAHYKACCYAGVTVSGINAEVMPGQWEYQVGPCVGTDSGDELWMSRYILTRVCEMYGVAVTFDPKPKEGDWNGAGCHTNYSTDPMRKEGGYAKIIEAIEKLGKKHAEHIKVYGEGNDRRLTGAHETAPITEFSYGVANRGASIRIPRQAEKEQKGYLEDRRPASNMDPYIVTGKIVRTTIIE